MEMIVLKKSKFTGNSVIASYSAGSLMNVCTTCNNGDILKQSPKNNTITIQTITR